MKSVNKSIFHVISDQSFIRECNSKSKSATWLFLYKKRWCRDAVLQGFSDQSTRWFKIAVDHLLKQIIFPGEDLYFLTASGNVFLFVSNTLQQITAVNLVSNTVKRIPQSPLGRRGTSSWRRSGMKLVANSDHFRFLFSELVDDRPVLFEYNSKSDRWRSIEPRENDGNLSGVGQNESDNVFLNAINTANGSVIVAVESEGNTPVILRPRFNGVNEELHVYGDGQMVTVRSNSADNSNGRVRTLCGIELRGLGLSPNGIQWKYMSEVPRELMQKISKKPYGVMMGGLEKSKGLVNVVLVSNFEGSWEIIWLSYDLRRKIWSWLPLPDCKMKGLNMAGIAFCGGLTLS